MRIPVPGLRGKFVLALLVAAALPLLVGLVLLETFGYRHLLAERGRVHQMEAMTLAQALEREAGAQAGHMATWLAADPTVAGFLSEKNSTYAARDPREAVLETARLDAAWESLSPGDPRVTAVTRNPAADDLQRYRQLHPSAAEILVTDAAGRAVAVTGKPSDFDQADEAWWVTGKALPDGEAWTDMLRFDDSARVFSLDVVRSLRDRGTFAGVMKMSVDVSALFTWLGFDGEAMGERWEIVLPDGRILVSSLSGYQPLSQSVETATMNRIRSQGSGWVSRIGSGGESRMAGFVVMGEDKEPGAYVVFSSRREDIVAPVKRQLVWVGVLFGLGVIACGLVGYGLIHRSILRPLSALGRAARSVSATARLHPSDLRDDSLSEAKRKAAEDDLARIKAIHTGDEVEALAGDLAVMTTRVLRYHRELEAEVAAKTAVIREDLEMARQFQNALLPSGYPEVPPAQVNNLLRLRFSHFYQPASTVGGDFFDLIELDENRVGVLIADVMGHGARSALVTAILRALVRNQTGTATHPGPFLAELNRHLHEVISRSGQTLFVTAFFMVLDTREGSISWAVAGHPAPLRVRRGSGKEPEPLWEGSSHQPALGLLPAVDYRTHEAPLAAGDVFLLFTDGAVEAENPFGVPFGLERLTTGFDQALDGPMAAIPAKIVCEVTAYQKRQQYDDDVCLVVVEAVAGS